MSTPGDRDPRDPQAGPAAPDAGALFSVDPGERPDCTVCAEPVESGASAICSECAEPFHLVLTNEAPAGDGAGKNCGEVWLNGEFLALEFGCARCLAVARGAPPTPVPPAAPPPGRETARGAARDAISSGRVRRQGISAREIVRRRRR